MFELYLFIELYVRKERKRALTNAAVIYSHFSSISKQMIARFASWMMHAFPLKENIFISEIAPVLYLLIDHSYDHKTIKLMTLIKTSIPSIPPIVIHKQCYYAR